MKVSVRLHLNDIITVITQGIVVIVIVFTPLPWKLNVEMIFLTRRLLLAFVQMIGNEQPIKECFE
jgi:hypothetical protein